MSNNNSQEITIFRDPPIQKEGLVLNDFDSKVSIIRKEKDGRYVRQKWAYESCFVNGSLIISPLLVYTYGYTKIGS